MSPGVKWTLNLSLLENHVSASFCDHFHSPPQKKTTNIFTHFFGCGEWSFNLFFSSSITHTLPPEVDLYWDARAKAKSKRRRGLGLMEKCATQLAVVATIFLIWWNSLNRYFKKWWFVDQPIKMVKVDFQGLNPFASVLLVAGETKTTWLGKNVPKREVVG